MRATSSDLALVAALVSLREQRPPTAAVVPSIAPGAKSMDGRAAALARFREKKRRRGRGGGSVIRYQVRKTLAEQRPRSRGRFTKRPTVDETVATVPVATPTHSSLSSTSSH